MSNPSGNPEGSIPSLCAALEAARAPPFHCDGRISYNSPLGRALIGRQAGEDVEVSAPAGDRYYAIKKIEFV